MAQIKKVCNTEFEINSPLCNILFYVSVRRFGTENKTLLKPAPVV